MVSALSLQAVLASRVLQLLDFVHGHADGIALELRTGAQHRQALLSALSAVSDTQTQLFTSGSDMQSQAHTHIHDDPLSFGLSRMHKHSHTHLKRAVSSVDTQLRESRLPVWLQGDLLLLDFSFRMSDSFCQRLKS